MSDIHTKIHRHNDGNGTLTFERFQDCTSIADACKARNNEDKFGSSEMKHAAEFPMIIVESYLNTHGITMSEFLGNKEHIRRMLTDPSLDHFRIWKGKI